MRTLLVMKYVKIVSNTTTQLIITKKTEVSKMN